MRGVEIQKSNELIWVFRFPETFRSADIRQLILDIEKLNPERRKFAALQDMSAINPRSVSAVARREAADVLREHRDLLEMMCLCEARVAPNPVIRGMLTVFDWLAPKPWPINNLYSGEAAELWLRGQLAKLGYAMPAQSIWQPSSVIRQGEIR